jgi:hypothetical protein
MTRLQSTVVQIFNVSNVCLLSCVLVRLYVVGTAWLTGVRMTACPQDKKEKGYEHLRSTSSVLLLTHPPVRARTQPTGRENRGGN